MLSSEKMADDVDVAHVASRTEGFSGSDLKAVCTAAAMAPLRELLAASGKSAKVGAVHSMLVLGRSCMLAASAPGCSRCALLGCRPLQA